VGSIHYQAEALGTAHAILCAREHLLGPVVVAFADTLFKADFVLDSSQEGIIWVKKVDDPRAFGVVELNESGIIKAFHEKPENFVSDLAIIGIYYFKDGAYLRHELEYLVEQGIMDKGEYQLTSALENMKSKGTAFFPGTVSEWLDCGNKDATVHTNSRYLEYLQERQNETLIDPSAVLEQCTVIPPCYIGADCRLSHVVLGPHVSVGRGSRIEHAVVENSIIREHAYIHGVHLRSSMTGAYTKVIGPSIPKTPATALELSLSDYSEILCP
jgi:glucose-1-phosphate thymidylyltransferase